MCSRSNNHTGRSRGEPNNTEAGELRRGGIARKNGEEMKRRVRVTRAKRKQQKDKMKTASNAHKLNRGQMKDKVGLHLNQTCTDLLTNTSMQV